MTRSPTGDWNMPGGAFGFFLLIVVLAFAAFVVVLFACGMLFAGCACELKEHVNAGLDEFGKVVNVDERRAGGLYCLWPWPPMSGEVPDHACLEFDQWDDPTALAHARRSLGIDPSICVYCQNGEWVCPEGSEPPVPAEGGSWGMIRRLYR